MRERFGPHLGDWTMNFFAETFMSSFSAPTVRPAWQRPEVRLSVGAENFEIDGNGRSEIVVPLEGGASLIPFNLRGLQVGPGAQ